MAGVREKLLTASDLATLCEVDLKTIHNWVDRGRIAHFRTPGRHLRFRAADVADFLRAWGYSVPRELAKASSRTLLVVGSKETVALVSRALGDASQQPSGTAGGPQAAGPGAPAGVGRVAARAPAKPGAPSPLPAGTAASSTGAPVSAPIRHAAHPYDALVYAGSEPADVYVVDVRAVADEIDVSAMLEALHRASPQATFVALSDEQVALPSFTAKVAYGDVAALRTALGAEAAPAGQAPGPTLVRPAASGGSSGRASSAAIAMNPSVEHDEDEGEETAPRGIAAGGSSR